MPVNSEHILEVLECHFIIQGIEGRLESATWQVRSFSRSWIDSAVGSRLQVRGLMGPAVLTTAKPTRILHRISTTRSSECGQRTDRFCSLEPSLGFRVWGLGVWDVPPME